VQKSAKRIFASHLPGKNTFALLTDFYTPAPIGSIASARMGNPLQITSLVQVMDARLLGHDNIRFSLCEMEILELIELITPHE